LARPRKLKPDYCHDAATGRAYVRINGQKKYLGGYGTQASRDAYDRLVGEWISAGRTAPPTSNSGRDDGITISILIAGFCHHAQRYYRKPDGTPTSEVDNMRQARPLRRFYGDTPAKKFGPLAMAALQQKMIELGWVPHVHQPPDQPRPHVLHVGRE